MSLKQVASYFIFALALVSACKQRVENPEQETSLSSTSTRKSMINQVLIACTFPNLIKIEAIDGTGYSNRVVIHQGQFELFRETWLRPLSYLHQVIKEWESEIKLAKLQKTGIKFGLTGIDGNGSGFFQYNLRKYQFERCGIPIE
jgi:hypothetical protein